MAYVVKIKGPIHFKIYRGDTHAISVNFEVNTTKSYVYDGDYITFTVRDRVTKQVIFTDRQVITKGSVYFILKEEVTKRLRIKTYIYDLEYRKKDNSIVTTYIKGIMEVLEDVTYD